MGHQKKLGVDIHLLALDACFYGISRAGWVTNLKKCKFLTDRIKFLGVDLNAKEATAEIHADRAKAILEMRQPRSTAEASSRASLVLFCAPFLPCLKKLLLPILKMVQSGEFKWEQCHARSYSEIKMLISLNIKNTIFDPTKTLILETDASKMACSAVIWQLDDNGQMQLLSTASSVLSTAQMRSPSVIRECSAITFALDKFQDLILGSQTKTYLLTDCSALQWLARSKNTSSRFFEQTILLTSFPNLEVIYLPGKNLVLCDV